MIAASTTFGLEGWASKLVLIAITIAIAGAAFWALRWLAPWLSTRAPAGPDLVKSRQRQTALALLSTILRYLVLIAALVTILVILAGGGGIGAIGGSAVFAIILGFASQRLLTDMIAGFFILFEGQYGVGDVIEVHPSGLTGIVTELGVRTTILRDANGDRCFVPNGQITAVRRFPSARTMLSVTLLTNDADAATAALLALAELAGRDSGIAAVAGRPTTREIGGGVASVHARVPVASTMVETARELVSALLKARLGEMLAADPVVSAVEPREAERPEVVAEP